MLVIPATAGATWPGANGRIAYVGIGTVQGIDSIRPDGSGHRVLTRDRDREPSWSADGRRIVFVRDKEWNAGSSFNQVVTMRADGQDQTRVTHDGKPDFSPSFSPDGQRIVYVDTGGRDVSLATIHTDGTHRDVLLRLKFSIASPGPQSVSPTYAPSGRRIVFAGVVERRNGLHREAIWSIRTDGSHLHRLTTAWREPRRSADSECIDVFPYWAPDGASHHLLALLGRLRPCERTPSVDHAGRRLARAPAVLASARGLSHALRDLAQRRPVCLCQLRRRLPH